MFDSVVGGGETTHVSTQHGWCHRTVLSVPATYLYGLVYTDLPDGLLFEHVEMLLSSGKLFN